MHHCLLCLVLTKLLKLSVMLWELELGLAKKLHDELLGLVHIIQSQEIVPKHIEGLENEDWKRVHLIQVVEESYLMQNLY